MGVHRYERHIKTRAMGIVAFLAMSCLAWGLPASAQASSGPVIERLSASNITQDDATVEAQINPAGLETTYELFMPEDPCNVPMECIRVHVVLAQGSIPATAADESISVDLASKHVSMEAGEQYGVAIIAKNSAGTVERHYSFRTLPKNTAPSEVVTGPAEATPNGYKLTGKLNPGNLPTTYYFQYIGDNQVECLEVENCWPQTAHMGPITGDTQQQVPPIEVTGLTVGVTYRYRLIASNADGTVTGNVASFTVGSPPSIESESVSNVTERDATLEAQINTEGLETSYQFHLWSDLWGEGRVHGRYQLPLAQRYVARLFRRSERQPRLEQRRRDPAAGRAVLLLGDRDERGRHGGHSRRWSVVHHARRRGPAARHQHHDFAPVRRRPAR